MDASLQRAKAQPSATPNHTPPAAPRLSLRTKLILLIIGIFTLTYAVTTFVTVRAAQSNLVDVVQTNLITRADDTVQLLRQQLTQTREFATTLANTASTLPLDADSMLTLISSNLATSRSVFGSTIAYEPFAFQPDVEFWAPYFSRTFTGQLQFTQLGTPEYNYPAQPWYALPIASRQARLSEPYFDAGGGDIWMVTWSVPFDNTSGAIIGVATADIAFSQTQAIVEDIELGDAGFAFLIDGNGTLLGTGEQTEAAQSFSLMETSYLEVAAATGANDWVAMLNDMRSGENGFRNLVDTDGHRVFVAYTPVAENTDWSLGLAFEEDELFAPVVALRNSLILLAALMVALTGLGLFFLTGSITRPLVQLADRARLVAAGQAGLTEGNLPAPLIVRTGDELEQLANAFNQMSADLALSFETLEQRVSDRTRDLETAGNVAGQITTVLDIETLLQQVVSLTVSSYDLYACFVFRYDAEGDFLYRAAAADADGQPIPIDPGVQLPLVSAAGVVALAARTRQTVTVNDTTSSNVYVPIGELAQTRAVVAIPMLLGEERLLGVFSAYATRANRFSPDDIKVLTTIAGQTAIAVRNAQLFAEATAARDDAEKSNKVKSQFLASMSHELRTPLNGILNFTQFISSGMVGEVNEKQINLLDQVYASGKHLLSLINDVLDISKIESGGLELFIENDIDLATEMKPVIATAESMLLGKTVDWVAEIEPNLPMITGDKRRIRQIMLNLVSNACKFTLQGEIRFTVQRQDDHILFTVKDTGTGIDPEDHDTIFEA
ncbi:MAG: GAF domain-containing protein, partial [Armatimonadetes bacterium]|nr:GAF domain-containing protein [Anaerolineae bacterium]